MMPPMYGMGMYGMPPYGWPMMPPMPPMYGMGQGENHAPQMPQMPQMQQNPFGNYPYGMWNNQTNNGNQPNNSGFQNGNLPR
jgi:hypothetical protein